MTTADVWKNIVWIEH